MVIGSYKKHVNENQEICGKLVVKLVVFWKFSKEVMTYENAKYVCQSIGDN